MYNHKLYKITTLTNTHVGSGESGVGIIDNTIQKDPLTKHPVFHSSSLKGALRNHFSNQLSKDDCELLFGGEKDKPGIIKFYTANLLTLPLRASKRVFYQCTSIIVLQNLINTINNFMPNDLSKFANELILLRRTRNDANDFYIYNDDDDTVIEDYTSSGKLTKEEFDCPINDLFPVYNSNFALFKDELLSEICEDSLPFIARNKIGDDGKSENLFYEEILPRQTIMWSLIGFPNKTEDNVKNKIGIFEKSLVDDSIKQIGANASIGYGCCKFSEINLGNEEN